MFPAKFDSIHRTLKNGEVVIIKQAVRKDARRLLQTVSQYMAESDYLLTAPEEFNPTIVDEKRWIKQLNDNPNCLLLIAIHNNKIIGNIDLKAESRKKTKHNAVLGIGILKSWRGLGLGKILMQCAIGWARENPSLELLWLNVFAGHDHGIALYKKMGFEETCRLKDFIKNADGSYTDNVVMRLPVK